MRARVAHIVSARGMAGAERFLASLVVGGHERGLEQVVLNPFANEAIDALRMHCAPVPCEGRPCDRLIDLPSSRRWLGRRLREFEPDIVHVVLFHAMALTSSLRQPRGTSRLLTNVSGDWTRLSNRRLVRTIDRMGGRRFDRVVAISQYVERFLVSEYGYPASKVTCIPLGWKGTPRPAVLEERPPSIICVGVLRPEKCHEVLLRAMPLVLRDIPSARLVLVGDGPLRDALEVQVASMGLRGNVDFLGSVEEVWPHLAAADVFAIASRVEAFCIAVVEAMAAGLPVVAPAVGALPELVQPGVTGELFGPADHEALALHLVRILRSPELRERMGAEARRAAEPLRLERAIGRYFTVFDELLATTPRRAVRPGLPSA